MGLTNYTEDSESLISSDGGIRVKGSSEWTTEDEKPDPKIGKIYNEWVVIRPINVRKKVGSILLADSSIEKNSQLVAVGRIVGIGEFAGNRSGVSKPEVGSYCLFPRFGGSRIELSGVKVVILPDDAIILEVDPKEFNSKSD